MTGEHCSLFILISSVLAAIVPANTTADAVTAVAPSVSAFGTRLLYCFRTARIPFQERCVVFQDEKDRQTIRNRGNSTSQQTKALFNLKVIRGTVPTPNNKAGREHPSPMNTKKLVGTQPLGLIFYYSRFNCQQTYFMIAHTQSFAYVGE